MCRACDETPDGVGRRCSREDGFSPVESDQRNRLRNLANARAALQAGDSQAASNALVHALAAQRSLDGGPAVPVSDPAVSAKPHRDFVISPSDVDLAQSHIAQINARRANTSKPPLVVEVTRQQHPAEPDPLAVWEQVTVRVSGPRADLDELSLGRVRTNAEKRVSTMGVLAASCAAVRLNDGRYLSRVDGGPNSTPGLVDAYVTDTPTGRWRTTLAPTPEDVAMAHQVRGWARVQPPTSDYIQAVRHSLAEEHLGMRSVGTAASAVGLYLSQKARSGPVGPALPGGRTGQQTHQHTSRHFSKVGDAVVTPAVVTKVVRVMHPDRPLPHYLYVMRTPDGDMVRWMASDTAGLEEGDQITLRGVVKGHSEFRGEKQTEMFRCEVRIHPRKIA